MTNPTDTAPRERVEKRLARLVLALEDHKAISRAQGEMWSLDVAEMLNRVEDLVRERDNARAEVRRWRSIATRMGAKVAALTSALEKARELKPLLISYEPWMDEHGDDVRCTVYPIYTFGQLRAALSALSAIEAVVAGSAPPAETACEVEGWRPIVPTVPTDANGHGPGGQRWCQPGHAPDRAWLLRFEDAERGDAVFTGPDAEAEAREMWARAFPSWNCYLFAAAPWSPATPAPPSDSALVRQDGTAEREPSNQQRGEGK